MLMLMLMARSKSPSYLEGNLTSDGAEYEIMTKMRELKNNFK